MTSPPAQRSEPREPALSMESYNTVVQTVHNVARPRPNPLCVLLATIGVFSSAAAHACYPPFNNMTLDPEPWDYLGYVVEEIIGLPGVFLIRCPPPPDGQQEPPAPPAPPPPPAPPSGLTGTVRVDMTPPMFRNAVEEAFDGFRPGVPPIGDIFIPGRKPPELVKNQPNGGAPPSLPPGAGPSVGVPQ